jgi:hypothetical protein
LTKKLEHPPVVSEMDEILARSSLLTCWTKEARFSPLGLKKGLGLPWSLTESHLSRSGPRVSPYKRVEIYHRKLSYAIFCMCSIHRIVLIFPILPFPEILSRSALLTVLSIGCAYSLRHSPGPHIRRTREAGLHLSPRRWNELPHCY